MAETPTLAERMWTDVTLVIVYVDRGSVVRREENFKLADMPEPDPDNFKRAIVRAIQSLYTAPVTAKSSVANELRFLPPSALREVIVQVNNVANVLLA